MRQIIYLQDVKNYLEQVEEKLFLLWDELTEEERKYKKQIVEKCLEIVENFSEE